MPDYLHWPTPRDPAGFFRLEQSKNGRTFVYQHTVHWHLDGEKIRPGQDKPIAWDIRCTPYPIDLSKPHYHCSGEGRQYKGRSKPKEPAYCENIHKKPRKTHCYGTSYGEKLPPTPCTSIICVLPKIHRWNEFYYSTKPPRWRNLHRYASETRPTPSVRLHAMELEPPPWIVNSRRYDDRLEHLDNQEGTGAGDTTSCRLGLHCGGTGKIEVHDVPYQTHVCLACAAREEEMSKAWMTKQLDNRQFHAVHRAEDVFRCTPEQNARVRGKRSQQVSK